MTQRRQPRLTQARLTRADEQADQQEQQTARQRVQALTERVAQLLESETPEVRLDVIRNLMAVDDIRIQGVYLIANAYDDNGPRVIYAETPVVLEGIGHRIGAGAGAPRKSLGVDRDFLTQDQVEQRIHDANADAFELQVLDGNLNRRRLQRHAERLRHLLPALSAGGTHRLRHRDAANLERAARCVLSFYNYYIVLQSMAHSKGRLLGQAVTYGHIYRQYLPTVDTRLLTSCTTTATTITHLLHARGLLVMVVPERLRVNLVLNRSGATQQAYHAFLAREDIAHMAMLIRRTGHFREVYRTIDHNADVIGRQ